MSEYTREEILKMIEEVGGPQNLDLSGQDLSGIDLSKEAIAKELEKYRQNNPDQTPLWFSDETEGIDLHGAILKKANLSEAHLEGVFLWEAHLEGAFLGEAHLGGAVLGWARLEGADLGWAHLEGAHLGWAHLERAFLRLAHLEGAFLGWAHLEEAHLWQAHLEGADLLGAHLKGAMLREANLKEAILRGAHLEKVDLYDVANLAGAYFYGVFLDQTRMKREQLGDRIGEDIHKEYYQAKEAYLLLKNNFNQIGRYDDASWAYVKERQMEKMTHHPKLAHIYYAKIERLPEGTSPKSWTWWRFYVKYTLKWLWDWIIELLCGYGERPGRVLGAMLVVLILAPFAYSLLGGLSHTNGRAATALDYLVYSFDAFTRIVGTDLLPLTMWGHLVTGLEAFLAILLASLFVYTLGRRISRS